MIVVSPTIKVLDDELEFTFARSGGPGGQNVNKVNSKAVLKWAIDDADHVPEDVIARFKASYHNQINKEGKVVIASDAYRDQGRNIEDCKDKLASMLAAVAKPPKVRKKTKPSKAQQRARLDKKRQNAEKKQSRQKIKY